MFAYLHTGNILTYLRTGKLLTIAGEWFERSCSLAREDVPETHRVIPRATRQCRVSRRECYTTHRAFMTRQYLTTHQCLVKLWTSQSPLSEHS